MDFKKAFDSVNRDILKRKLQAIGICDDLYQWLCDYLNDRKQFTNVYSKHSSVKIIVFGVPQGSLLGPRLFSIHVNDLPDFVSKGYLFMFADDTTLYYIGKDIEGVIDMMNEAAKELFNWCKKNQLTVRTGKTEAMILSHRDFTGPLKPAWFGTSMINYVTHSTCLGITIDNKLSWNKQLSKVTTSFNSKLKKLRRLRYLPVNVKEETYYNTVVSSMTYCISVWGTSSPTVLQELDALHAREAKLVYGIKEKMSVENALTQVNWEPISYIYKRRILSWMHRIYYESCPRVISERFTKKSDRLRKPLQSEIPRYRKETGRNSLRYREPVIWNTMSTDLKQDKNLNTFRNNIKQFKNRINQITFRTEVCMINNKHRDYNIIE